MVKALTSAMALLLAVVGFSATVQAATQSLEQRVERLERRADNPVLIQLSRRLAEQQRQIQELYGEIDRLKYQLSQTRDKMAKQYQETDERINQLETRPAGKAVTAVPVVSSEAVTPVVESREATKEAAAESKAKTRAIHPATAEEKKAYDQAFGLIKKSDYKSASEAFAKFKKQYPQSELASNASYWEGESEVILGHDQKALEAFKMVYEKYPDSSKALDALLRSADMHQEMGQVKEAKALYEKLLKAFPKGKAATKAEQRLKDLKSK
ncbi:MAG: tol-pal system protein YbgF [Hydrogenovibrio sp.]